MFKRDRGIISISVPGVPGSIRVCDIRAPRTRDYRIANRRPFNLLSIPNLDSNLRVLGDNLGRAGDAPVKAEAPLQIRRR